ncbi:MAG: hypothetical protein ACTSO9_15860 [Candidatus Helarchaeota archaeon]
MNNYKLIRICGIFASFIGILILFIGNVKNPANFRLLSDLVQNILIFNFVLLLFLPEEKDLENAIILGLFTMILDFFLETIAVWLNWWYPKGGFQWPPLLIVPLEMVISFMIIGTTTGILLHFPEKIRKMDFKLLNWLKFFVKNSKLDLFWRIIFVFLIAVVGANGDYGAGWDIWVPGPGWQWIYTFFVWFCSGLIILLFFYFLEKKKMK